MGEDNRVEPARKGKLASRSFLVGCAALSLMPLAGCWWSTEDDSAAVRPLSGETSYIVATQSNMRTGIVVARKDRRTANDGSGRTMCMEAPPDATNNFASNYSLALKATAKLANGASGDAKMDVAKSLATSLAHFSQPTQGLLMYRFGMAQLCTEYMNGVIAPITYSRAANEMLVLAEMLTEEELLLTDGKISGEYNNSSNTSPVPPTLGNSSGSDGSSGGAHARNSSGDQSSGSASSSGASSSSGSSSSGGELRRRKLFQFWKQ